MSKMMSLRKMGRAACLALAMVPAFLQAPAQAREMRVSIFEPPQGFYAKILQSWIDQVNPKLSAGNSFKLYPGSILGSPVAQRELVQKGVADVALVVPIYTPGLFPGSSVVELPGVASSSAVGTDVLNTLLEEGQISDEYADFKVVAVFAIPPFRIFMRENGAVAPEDLQGLTMRTSSPFGSKLLDMVGVTGTVVPVNQVHESLERGVVDGMVWTLDAYNTFKLYELAPEITNVEFTSAPLAILMNKNTYNALSEADRAAVDSLSGRAASEWIAGELDAYIAELIAKFRDQEGVTLVDLDAEQKKVWADALANAPQAWIEAQPEGFDGAGVLKRVQGMQAE